MPAGNAYPSGHLVPSPILGLANAPIVETKFLELAMSLLDFSPRIPLGTFSILLLTRFRRKLVLLNNWINFKEQVYHTLIVQKVDGQNRSTEGCSKLKRSVDMTSWGKNRNVNMMSFPFPCWLCLSIGIYKNEEPFLR